MLDLDADNLKILSKKDKVVSNYMERLNTVNDDPRFQSYMSAEEDDRKILNSIKKEYREKGIAEGIKEGVQTTTFNAVKNLLNNNVGDDIILSSFDISKEELENIKNDI